MTTLLRTYQGLNDTEHPLPGDPVPRRADDRNAMPARHSVGAVCQLTDMSNESSWSLPMLMHVVRIPFGPSNRRTLNHFLGPPYCNMLREIIRLFFRSAVTRVTSVLVHRQRLAVVVQDARQRR